MANEERIDSIVSSKAYKQLDDLSAKLTITQKNLVDNINAAIQFNNVLGNSKTIKELEVNSNNAAKSIDRLTKEQEKSRLAEIRLQQAREKSIDKYNAQLKRQEQATAKAAAAASKAASPYNQLAASLAKAEKEALDLGAAFGSSSKQFKNATSDVQKLRTQINSLEQPLGKFQRNVGNYWGSFKSGLSGVISQFVGFYAAFSILQKVLRNNSEISDSLSDVRRTAGLTADEADRLSESLKKINTRTGLKGLLDIAVIGGQLGIAKDELAGFTKAVDQLAVVLSNEIPGGAEAVATSLGKINGVFKVQQKEGTNTEESLNRTGSAILKLGQVGLATGEYLQDFTLRVAGSASVAKISLPTILAYSAVLEETGSSAEVAGTAFNKLVGSLASKRKDFFAIAQIADAKLTLKEFTDLINTDANAALQLFFKGLNKGGVNLTEFTDLLDTLKIKTGPGKNAIIALAKNQELLNSRILESTAAYESGSLAADQFSIKNDNLASSIDKLGNAFVNATTSGKVAGFFKTIIDGVSETISIFNKLFNSKSYQEFFIRLGGGGNVFDRVQTQNNLKRGATKTFPGGVGNAGNLFPVEQDEAKPEDLTTTVKAKAKKVSDTRKQVLEQRLKEIKLIEDAILNNEKSTLDERLKAIKSYEDKAQVLIINAKNSKVLTALESSNKLKEIDLEASKDRLKIRKDAQKAELDALEIQFNNQIEAAKKADRVLLDQLALASEQRQSLLSESSQSELLILAQQFSEGELTAEEYAQRRVEIQRKLTADLINEDIRAVQLLIDLQKAAGIDTLDNEKKLAEFKQKLSKETVDNQIEDLERLQERERELIGKRKEIAQELGNFAIAIVQGQFRQSEDLLIKEGEQIDIKKARDIDSVQRSIASEQEKADRIAIINAQTENKKEILERKQRQLDIERAKFDKQAGIAQIIVSTASAVAQALPNIPLSILIAALGAAQLATAIATPLPRFEKGGVMGKTGLAEFGHGTELRIDPDGKMSLTNSTPEVGMVQKGTEFISNKDLMKILSSPDQLSYAGAGSIDMKDVISATKHSEKSIVNAILSTKQRSGKGVSYYSTSKGQLYRNRNIN